MQSRNERVIHRRAMEQKEQGVETPPGELSRYGVSWTDQATGCVIAV